MHNTEIYLYHIDTKSYLSVAVEKKGSPCANIGDYKCLHTIEKVNMNNTEGPISNGDMFRFITTQTTHPGLVCLYSSELGNCYYDKKREDLGQSDTKKQVWVLQKEDGDGVINSGDVVVFKSFYWPKAGLYVFGDSDVGCSNGEFHRWKVVKRDDEKGLSEE